MKWLFRKQTEQTFVPRPNTSEVFVFSMYSSMEQMNEVWEVTKRVLRDILEAKDVRPRDTR